MMTALEKKTNGNRLGLLRDLTDKLPAFPQEILPHVHGCKEHKMKCGTCVSWNLLNQDEISCARWFNSAGTIFPEHLHEEREWLIVYKGSMFITIGYEERRLNVGESIIIEPNTLHSARSLEDCWYLGIAIPKSASWPE